MIVNGNGGDKSRNPEKLDSVPGCALEGLQAILRLLNASWR